MGTTFNEYDESINYTLVLTFVLLTGFLLLFSIHQRKLEVWACYPWVTYWFHRVTSGTASRLMLGWHTFEVVWVMRRISSFQIFIVTFR